MKEKTEEETIEVDVDKVSNLTEKILNAIVEGEPKLNELTLNDVILATGNAVTYLDRELSKKNEM